jgi:hypothetical protein
MTTVAFSFLGTRKNACQEEKEGRHELSEQNIPTPSPPRLPPGLEISSGQKKKKKSLQDRCFAK